MDTYYEGRLPLGAWLVKSILQLSISFFIVHLYAYAMSMFTCNLSVRIVYAIRLSFNNWFYQRNWIYRKI